MIGWKYPSFLLHPEPRINYTIMNSFKVCSQFPFPLGSRVHFPILRHSSSRELTIEILRMLRHIFNQCNGVTEITYSPPAGPFHSVTRYLYSLFSTSRNTRVFSHSIDPCQYIFNFADCDLNKLIGESSFRCRYWMWCTFPSGSC